MPHRNTVAAFGLALLACTSLAHGQLTFSNATTDNGLGSNTINAVYATGCSIYAATENGLGISTDGGVVWSNYDQSTSSGLASSNILGVFVSDGVIYAATYAGVCISTNGGALWSCTGPDQGLPGYETRGICRSGGVLYAATESGLGISTDDGASWSGTLNGLFLNGVHADAETVCAGASKGGVQISTDGGATWTTSSPGGGIPISGVFVGDGIIYATSAGGATGPGGLYVSDDGGSSWTTFDMKSGLGSNTANGVYVADGKIFVATAGGLSISDDDGATWTTSTTADGLGSDGVNGVFHFAGSTYAATSAGVGVALALNGTNGTIVTNVTAANGLGSNIVNDVFVRGDSIYVATQPVGPLTGPFCDDWQGGVSISHDGGSTWSNSGVADGLPSDYVNAICEDGGVIYVATQDGVGISTDGGATWTASTTSDGLGSRYVYDIYATDGVVYAACWEGIENVNIGGVSISTDQGKSWQNFTDPCSCANPDWSCFANAIYVSDGVIYCGVLSCFGGCGVSSLWTSTDGGKSWSALGPADMPCVDDIFVRDGTIYLALQGITEDAQCAPGGVGISIDGGTTWSYSSFADGLGGGLVTSIAADSAGMVYATTVYATSGGPSEGCPTEWTGGLSVSRNGGLSWRNLTLDDGLCSDYLTSVQWSDGKVYTAGYCDPAIGEGLGGLSILATTCVADLTGDLSVGADDLTRLLSWWDANCKSNPDACEADLDGSGVIDRGDLETLLCLWGDCLTLSN